MNGSGPDPLLLGLAAGDGQAFAALYDRFAARMYRVALRSLSCRQDAEDVVQEVFLAVVRSHEGLGAVRDLTAYLFTVLHRAIGHCILRRARAQAACEAASKQTVASIEELVSDDSDRHELWRAIRSLPDEQREVVSLRIDGELTFAQIAHITGVSVNTAASRYRYALQKLRSSLFRRRALAEGN